MPMKGAGIQAASQRLCRGGISGNPGCRQGPCHLQTRWSRRDPERSPSPDLLLELPSQGSPYRLSRPSQTRLLGSPEVSAEADLVQAAW